MENAFIDKQHGGADRRRHEIMTIWLMLLPTLVLFFTVSVYPFLWLFRYIFYDFNGFTSYFIGLDNIKRLWGDELYWKSVLNTLEYSTLKLTTILPLSLTVAVMINGNLKGKGAFRIVFFVPTVISSAVTSLIFYFI